MEKPFDVTWNPENAAQKQENEAFPRFHVSGNRGNKVGKVDDKP